MIVAGFTSLINPWHNTTKLNDRRVASNTSHIFYKLRRMQIIKLLGARHVRMRKLKDMDHITAEQARSKEYIDNKIKHDEAYAALSVQR